MLRLGFCYVQLKQYEGAIWKTLPPLFNHPPIGRPGEFLGGPRRRRRTPSRWNRTPRMRG